MLWLWILLGALALLALLYVLMVMPRLRGRRDFSVFSTRMFAHRGLHDNATDAPENSLPAFVRALEAGYGIEFDVRLSADGVPMVFHDPSLLRVCGVDKPVRAFTAAQLQQMPLCGSTACIPTMQQVLDLVAGRVPLLIEFKMESASTALCRAAMALLDRYEGVYCVESFNPLALFWLRFRRKNVIRGQLSSDYRGEKKGILGFLHTHMVFNFLTAPDFISYRLRSIGRWSFQLCRRLYKSVCFGWTVQSEEELRQARQIFDYVIFDSFVPKDGAKP